MYTSTKCTYIFNKDLDLRNKNKQISYFQILTRLSQPPDTSCLIGWCLPEGSNRSPGLMAGAQLTALQPIWQAIKAESEQIQGQTTKAWSDIGQQGT